MLVKNFNRKKNLSIEFIQKILIFSIFLARGTINDNKNRQTISYDKFYDV